MIGAFCFGLQVEQETFRPGQVELLDMIAQSGETLLALLDATLDLTKMETNSLKLDEQPIALCKLAGDAIQLLRVRMRYFFGYPKSVLGEHTATC
jgi:signal transduction histidine kinase